MTLQMSLVLLEQASLIAKWFHQVNKQTDGWMKSISVSPASAMGDRKAKYVKKDESLKYQKS